mgnify:CR=1 FL=1
MKHLKMRLKKYWKLCLLVLVLAAINQVFSLLDPYIVRLVIDRFAVKFDSYTLHQFVRGVGTLLLLAVGSAFV